MRRSIGKDIVAPPITVREIATMDVVVAGIGVRLSHFPLVIVCPVEAEELLRIFG